MATSSLELGIDIGDIDLVCQMGSPRAVNAFLQRVGRAGHAIGAIPKGRLFPLSLDDLLECSALLHAVAHDELDRIRVPDKPLDALAQQVVAEVACQDWPLDALFERFRHAQPYRDLALAEFEAVVQMLADGYTTRRGRRGAYLHFDAVNRILRARRGARLAAVTNAGVIPDQFDYEVVLQPDGHRVGTLNEDFAFESLPGDIFQLGNASYRIAKIETGKVMVEDAHGQPPTMPFWLGESLGRTDELSGAVSHLCEKADDLLAQGGMAACERWLQADLHLPHAAAYQLALYLAASKASLGVLPSRSHIVLERFFDEVGDTHLVIHSPYGSRINRAWGLALRKRMCRKFNFELQASALEDSIVLSLGPTHSFPLEDIAHYLKAASAHDVLVQALLDAPLFGTRWRWNATAALAVRRMNGGRKVPPQFQRSDAEDLLTVVFPDQVACAENLVGEREIPHHPLVDQTLRDCLHESMDAEGFIHLLTRMESGEVQVTARDLASPSPMAHAILNAKPYAFLDGGAAEERRTKAVATQPLMDVHTAEDMGRLDPQVIAQVREDTWPEIRSAEELHDALMVHGFLTTAEAPQDAEGPQFALELARQRRITRLQRPAGSLLYVAAERLHEFLAVFPSLLMSPPIAPTARQQPSPDDALREIVRGRLELLGPVTVETLAAPLELDSSTMLMALLQLEAEGAVMRGAFSAPGAQEWCDRRLLARIHRGTRDKLRAEFSPVPPAQFMRFLFRWHQLAGSEGVARQPGSADERRLGEAGLAAVLRQLEGHAASASAWEDDLLPARVGDYLPPMLDKLCASGRVAWWRPTDVPPEAVAASGRQGAGPGEGTSTLQSGSKGGSRSGPVRATPVLLCEREALPYWQQATGALQAGASASHPTADGPAGGQAGEIDNRALSSPAQQVLAVLRAHGASFFADLRRDARLLGTQVEQALAELVAHGLVTCDSFAGLRTLVMPEDKRNKLRRKRGVLNGAAHDPMDDAGRWSLVRRALPPETPAGALAAPHVEHIARVLLRRYGVVFRKLLEREDGLPPWRELFYVLRRLEARGEVRGGRFVSGFSGEQFALPEAATALRRAARTPGSERVALSAADPLNLVGILTPGDKLARLAGNRVLFEGGVPVALHSAGETRFLRELPAAQQWELKNLLIRRSPVVANAPVEPAGPAEALLDSP